ncbi:MAG: hypothetical protein LBM04_09140 [Opitutaceae bacterium]|jgi:hypothetical protein|nr:hypothetical protein [Opitutaceae bacterium]
MKHTTRAYFPANKQDAFIWAGNHITGLEAIGAALDVPAAIIAAFRADYTHLGQLYGWRNNAVALGREYNQAIERAEWDLGGPDVLIRPVIPANLGDKQFAIIAGLYNRLFANIDAIENNPACTDEIRRQLFILPPARPAPDLLALSANVKAEFTGGKVLLHGHRPAPAKFWHIDVDRSDGHGRVEAGLVVGAKFTDHHDLPDKPTTWTYTVELRDKENTPVGKVSVVSITIWKGRADEGPEAGI